MNLLTYRLKNTILTYEFTFTYYFNALTLLIHRQERHHETYQCSDQAKLGEVTGDRCE